MTERTPAPILATSETHLTPQQRFEAAIARFHDHTELLRSLTRFDLQILGGFMTLQLGLAAWLVDHPPNGVVEKIGLVTLSATLTGAVMWLLYTQYRRRKEIVASLARIKVFLQFEELGAYIPRQSLDAPMMFKPWWPWYLIACVITFVAVLGIILFGGFQQRSNMPMKPTSVISESA